MATKDNARKVLAPIEVRLSRRGMAYLAALERRYRRLTRAEIVESALGVMLAEVNPGLYQEINNDRS